MAPRSLSQSDSSGSRSRIRVASTRRATSRFSAGVVKKYCVTACCVSALSSPPNAAEMAASWSADKPGLPRNIMCSVACAVPGNPAGAFVRADAVIDHRRDHRRERVADDDDLQTVGQRGAQNILRAARHRLRPARAEKMEMKMKRRAAWFLAVISLIFRQP